MPSYLKNEVLLVDYPFTDRTSSKVRPAIVFQEPHPSHDVFIVPLTSRTGRLLPGEFLLGDWQAAGLNVPSALKRGLHAIHPRLIIKRVGQLLPVDAQRVEQSLRQWLGL